MALRLQMQAAKLYGRRDYAGAGLKFEQLVALDPTDIFASYMLASCFEQQGRYVEALRLAEEVAHCWPDSLAAIQSASRLAVVVQDYDKAAQYLRRALALPEVQAEIPKEIAMPKPLLWILRVLVSLPILRSRVRRDAVNQLELGSQAMELQAWKRWALEFLAWHAGKEPGSQVSLVH